MSRHKCCFTDLKTIPEGTTYLEVTSSDSNGTGYRDLSGNDYRKIPRSVETLSIDFVDFNGRKSHFPDWITSLRVKSSWCEELPVLPSGLRKLYVSANIRVLTGQFRDLEEIRLFNCPGLTVVGELPAVMKIIRIADCPCLVNWSFLPSLRVNRLELIEVKLPRAPATYPDEITALVIKRCKENGDVQPRLVTGHFTYKGKSSPRHSTPLSFSVSAKDMRLASIRLGANAVPEGVESLTLTKCCWVQHVVLPQSLRSLTVKGDGSTSLGKLPENLESLRLKDMVYLRSYGGLPPFLHHIEIENIYEPTDFPQLRHLQSAKIDYAVSTVVDPETGDSRQVTFTDGNEYLAALPQRIKSARF